MTSTVRTSLLKLSTQILTQRLILNTTLSSSSIAFINSLPKHHYSSIDSSGERLPCWYAPPALPHHPYPPLADNISTDVCIIGAGITGISTAYNLIKKGKHVTIVDDGELCSGETGRTSAHLSFALDDRFYNLAYLHGDAGAQTAYRSHRAAIDWIEATCRREQIDCDFARVPGYLIGKEPPQPPQPPEGNIDRELQHEYEICRKIEMAEISKIANAPFGMDATIRSGEALRFERQARFHPLKYVYQMAERIERDGGKIYGNTHIAKWEDNDYSPEHGTRNKVLHTKDGRKIYADDIVMATCMPLHKLAIVGKLEPFRSYVIAAEFNNNNNNNNNNRFLLWDTNSPYNYVNVVPYQNDKDLILIGGQDHKVAMHMSTQIERFDYLEAWGRARWPSAIGAVLHRWSGQIMEPVDLLAYIGRDRSESHLFVCAGDSGNGLTHGTIAGLIIPALICNDEIAKYKDWIALYNPARKTLKRLPKLISHLLEVNRQYSDWIKRGDVTDVEEIAIGCGAIVRKGLALAAVYKDEQGRVSACSAVCSHMKGIVRWNPAEKTFDCPIHGSRFDKYGKVVSGPACDDLSPVQL